MVENSSNASAACSAKLHWVELEGIVAPTNQASLAMSMIEEKYKSSEYLAHNPSWDEEDSPWKARLVLKIIREQGISSHSICEVGCGAGGVLEELRKSLSDAELFGFDIAPDAERFWATRQASDIRFRVGDFHELN